jgi:hypothetical protein
MQADISNADAPLAITASRAVFLIVTDGCHGCRLLLLLLPQVPQPYQVQREFQGCGHLCLML